MPPSFLPEKNQEFSSFKLRFFLVDGLYILGIYIFSLFLNSAQCNVFFLPDILSECLHILSEHIFAFMDRHNSYATRVECFKYVVSFGFICVPWLAALNFFSRRNFLVNHASLLLKRKDFKLLFGLLIMSIILVYLFLFNIDFSMDPGHEPSRRLIRRLYQNIDLWSSQAFRTVACTLLPSYLLTELYAYSWVLIKKTRSKENV